MASAVVRRGMLPIYRGGRQAIKARGMRLILFALFALGALALCRVLLAWLAERRLDQAAEAHVVQRRRPAARRRRGAGAGHGADRTGGRAQRLLRPSPRCRRGAVEGGQGQILHRLGQQLRRAGGDARRPGRARRAGRARSIAIRRATAPGIRCCARATSSARSGWSSSRSAFTSAAPCSWRATPASRPGASRRATSMRPTASSPSCGAIPRRCAPTSTSGRARPRMRRRPMNDRDEPVRIGARSRARVRAHRLSESTRPG